MYCELQINDITATTPQLSTSNTLYPVQVYSQATHRRNIKGTGMLQADALPLYFVGEMKRQEKYLILSTRQTSVAAFLLQAKIFFVD